MSFNKKQFEKLIRDTLVDMEHWSQAAVNLLLGTAAQESQFGHFLYQADGGPALGVFQMEPFTENSIWDDFLKYKPRLRDWIINTCGVYGPDPDSLLYDLQYQIAMCRIRYLWVPKSLPDHDDIEEMARYWKRYYNTFKGKGRVTEFITNYQRYVL